MNLHCEVRIWQKIYNRFSMTVYVKGVVWFNVNKTLVYFSIIEENFSTGLAAQNSPKTESIPLKALYAGLGI